MTIATLTQTPGRNRQPSDFAELLRAIHEQDLMKRRYAYYTGKISLLLVAFASVWFGFFLVGDSWFQLILAGLLGLLLTQFGFLGHDAAHRQIFKSGPANEVLSSVIGGLLVGMSSTWWTKKHTKHHAAPNQIGKDPDIAPTVIRFHPNGTVQHSRVLQFLSQRQGWWFFPILIFEGVNLHLQSVQTLLARGVVKRRAMEITFMTVRLAGYLAVLFLFLPAGLAAAFVGVQLAVFGVYLGCSFAPNHKGMPMVPETMSIDFFRRQVLMSRNVGSSRLVTFALGGLNFQIEHHLFPSMPRPSLRRAQSTVREFCRSKSVPYTETGLFRSYGIVVRYLNRVGLRARDPFQCPLVAAYRPRG